MTSSTGHTPQREDILAAYSDWLFYERRDLHREMLAGMSVAQQIHMARCAYGTTFAGHWHFPAEGKLPPASDRAALVLGAVGIAIPAEPDGERYTDRRPDPLSALIRAFRDQHLVFTAASCRLSSDDALIDAVAVETIDPIVRQLTDETPEATTMEGAVEALALALDSPDMPAMAFALVDAAHKYLRYLA